MTYPGFVGQPGPPPITAIGQQVRQSRAGKPTGGYSTTVIDAMGTHAPTAAVTALTAGGPEAATDDPFPINAENFELDFDQAPLGGPADFGSAADYTGEGGS